MSELTISDETVEAIAQRVAELLREEPVEVEGLIDAAEVARRLGVDRGWVYENADRLGAKRINEGPRSRMRFDPAKLADALAPRPFTPPESPARRRPNRKAPTVELLPIGGIR